MHRVVDAQRCVGATTSIAIAIALILVGCGRPTPSVMPGASAPLAASAAEATPARPTEPAIRKPYESMPPPPPHEPTPLPDLSEPAASKPVPKAGKQVLRCMVKGRAVYMDLNAVCAEGEGERVTVFPTEGVGQPR